VRPAWPIFSQPGCAFRLGVFLADRGSSPAEIEIPVATVGYGPTWFLEAQQTFRTDASSAGILRGSGGHRLRQPKVVGFRRLPPNAPPWYRETEN